MARSKTTYDIQMEWSVDGRTFWVTIDTGYHTRSTAEWTIGRWRQKNICSEDPFRVVEHEPAQQTLTVNPPSPIL